MNKKIVNLRFVAILLVVIGHSIIIYDPQWGYYQTSYSIPLLTIIKKIINCIQMPLFFSISGFLFYYSINKETKYLKTCKNKFIRLIIPFLVVGTIYMLPIRYLIEFNDNSLKKNILFMIIGKDSGHLWFLPTLFLMFAAYYFIGKAINKYNEKAEYPAFICLTIANFFSFIFPSYLGNLFKYLIFFHLGYEINKKEWLKLKKSKTIIIIALSIILLICYLFLHKILNQNINNLLLLIFGLTACLSLYNIIPENSYTITNKISKDSFGIYLFHSPLCYITFKYLGEYNPIIVISINLLFALIALLITNFLRKLKLGFIIGERGKQ